MHPYRGIVHVYRRSDGLSTRPDDQNTVTHQYTDTNDTPRDPLNGLVTLVIIVKIYSHLKLIKKCVLFSLGTIFQRFELASP